VRHGSQSMVKVVIKTAELSRVFDFEEANPAVSALLPLMSMMASMTRDIVIVFTDEAGWQKMQEKLKK
jgi:hypothetical protein